MVDLKHEPYKLSISIEDLKKALQAYIPPKRWEPEEGKLACLVMPVKIMWSRGDGWFDVCDNDGNCLKVSRNELVSYNIENNKERSMKAMKDAVLTVAKQLAKANNTVTTLEIKVELRRDYPYYFWTQQAVSDYMSQLAGDGIFDYKDNGTYRTYSLVGSPVNKPLASKVIAPSTPAVTTRRKGRPRKKTTFISQADAVMMASNKNLEYITVQRKAGPVQYSTQAIRSQKKSPVSFALRAQGNISEIIVAGASYLVR